MLKLNGENLNCENVWQIAQRKTKLTLADEARKRILESRAYIEGQIEQGEVIYGVNTGFGAFSSVKISQPDIVQLQKNLIRSHSSGVGIPFSLEQTRAIMALRANALARGHSGVRDVIIEK